MLDTTCIRLGPSKTCAQEQNTAAVRLVHQHNDRARSCIRTQPAIAGQGMVHLPEPPPVAVVVLWKRSDLIYASCLQSPVMKSFLYLSNLGVF